MWHILHCAGEFVTNPGKMSFALASLAFAVFLYYLIRRDDVPLRFRTYAAYGHITALVFPFAFFSYTMSCNVGILSCNRVLFDAATYSIPTAMLVSFLLGYFTIPRLYLAKRGTTLISGGHLFEFAKSVCSEAGIKAPKIYAIDSAKPQALSTTGKKASVFLSLNLLEALTKKESEAVLLHEIAHIKRGTAGFKLSAALMRFSPFYFFNSFKSDLAEEEVKADAFVVGMQKTSRHLESAKKKQEILSRAS